MSESTTQCCPLCGLEASRILAKQLRRGRGQVAYCQACDHGFLLPQQQMDMKQFYAEQYRQEYSHNATEAATNARELFEVYKRYQHGRLDLIKPLLGVDTKLLEVGASAGQFLCHVKNIVKTADAIELDKACKVFLEQELQISADDEYLENSRFKNQRYDVVCAFQVMEHVENPAAFIRSLRAVTRPGGTIFIEVPNLHDPLLSVWDVPTYRTFYYHAAHLHYFSEASLRNVAHAAGFSADAVEISFSQDYNLLNHLHWVMNDGPQSDCHVGLSEIGLTGPNAEISQWLNQEMRALNRRYIDKLIAAKSTSNLMMRLQNA